MFSPTPAGTIPPSGFFDNGPWIFVFKSLWSCTVLLGQVNRQIITLSLFLFELNWIIWPAQTFWSLFSGTPLNCSSAHQTKNIWRPWLSSWLSTKSMVGSLPDIRQVFPIWLLATCRRRRNSDRSVILAKQKRSCQSALKSWSQLKEMICK